MGLALDLADALAWRATGRVAVSACTVGCKWSYLNHDEPGWQLDLLDRIDLADLPQRASLPERALPIGAPAGTLTAEAAAALGLTTACMVGIGLIDAHAGGVALLGGRDAAALNRSLAMIAGTSTCHMAVSAEPRFVPGIWGPYQGAMLPGWWLNEGGQSATGALLDHVLDWHAEGRALGADRHAMVSNAIAGRVAERGPGFVDGLRVRPDFNGNRSPHANPLARGAIEGLTLDASFDSLLRLYYAAATGIALGTREIIAAQNRAGYAIDRLHLTGGHANSPILPRLYADATGCTVITTPDTDSVLLGTACVAACAARLYPDLAGAARAMRPREVEMRPDPAIRAYFDGEYAAFLGMQG
jgi:FGGY-family pentulose kinase